MASVTATPRALTESERATLRSFGVEDRLPGAVPRPLEPAIVAWFQALVGEDSVAGIAEARVAWLLAGGPIRWADRFLAQEASPELASALREAWPCLTPHETPMAMPEQPLHGESALSRAAGRIGRVSRVNLRRDRAVSAR